MVGINGARQFVMDSLLARKRGAKYLPRRDVGTYLVLILKVELLLEDVFRKAKTVEQRAARKLNTMI